MKKIFALVDCNNFFVSCERVFNPHLESRPVVVLSNNDGCIIARSNEVKRIGIPMGMPLFEARKLIRYHNIQVYSSNYSLYGDMSARVMNTLRNLTPQIEIYSIDEAFLNLAGFENRELNNYGYNICKTVKKWTGIPVSIGIASTKTLAKVASHIAKKMPGANGVFTISNDTSSREILSQIPISDIWGIGSRWTKMLNKQGIKTALDFHDVPEQWVRKSMGVTGARTHLELHGQACFNIEDQPPDKKTIRVSRSFAKPIITRQKLRENIASFANRASEKMRQNGLVASIVYVFALTSRFNPQDYYKGIASYAPPSPTNHAIEITRAAVTAFEDIWRPGLKFKKAGVIMLGLTRAENIQNNLFSSSSAKIDARKQRLMVAFDKINTQIGNNKIHLGAIGLNRRTKYSIYTTQNYRSPRYTTCWEELPSVKA